MQNLAAWKSNPTAGSPAHRPGASRRQTRQLKNIPAGNTGAPNPHIPAGIGLSFAFLDSRLPGREFRGVTRTARVPRQLAARDAERTPSAELAGAQRSGQHTGMRL